MAFTWKSCLLFAYVIPLLLLAAVAFAGTLVLAIIGIGVATESNSCVDSTGNTTSCVNSDSLTTSLTDASPGSSVSGDLPEEFLYWMAGATACGLIFSVIATLSLWALEDVIRRLTKRRQDSLSTEIEMEEKGDNVDAPPRSPTPPPAMDTIGGREVFVKSKSKLRKLNCGALTALFFSCLCGILSLLCCKCYFPVKVLWAIAVGLNHSSRQDRTVTPFVIVEILVAIAFPFLIFAGGVFMANVVDFITYGAADARTALPRFLSSVKFQKGDKYDYWVIENSFYFSLKKRAEKDRIEHGFCYSCYPNFATWVLVAIVSLSVNLAVSYFADIALDKQVSVNACNDPRIDRTFSCFNASTLAYVDCVNNTDVTLIHCFKFFRFGVDVDLIQSLATSYAFYLVAASIFGHLFLGMKVLMHISKRRIWGAVMVVVGIVLFLTSVVVIIIWLNGYISAAVGELSRVNVINLAQFVMVSWFVLLIGLLMVGGTWAEKKPKQK